MTLGLSLEVFTLVHTIISLVALGAGFGVLFGLLNGVWSGPWTAVFLLFTVLTNVTGLMFPFNGFLPSHAVAILSLILLAVAIFALYGRHLAGPWRATSRPAGDHAATCSHGSSSTSHATSARRAPMMCDA